MFNVKLRKLAKKADKRLPFKQSYFSNHHKTYSCIHCRAHLANHDELISKLFQGNHGRAYLFNKVTNIGCKPAVQRELLTGLHAVADIYCDICETTLGWKYEQAFVPSQKYKEGKYIIELVHMLKENDWDLTSYNAGQLLQEAEKETNLEDNRQLGGLNGFGIGFNNNPADNIAGRRDTISEPVLTIHDINSGKNTKAPEVYVGDDVTIDQNVSSIENRHQDSDQVHY